MIRHALLGVLAAISCARQATAWDDKCWDFNSFRASLWLPFSKGDTRSRQWAVAAKMAARAKEEADAYLPLFECLRFSDCLLARLFPPQASDDDATVEAPAPLDRDAFRHVLSFWQPVPQPPDDDSRESSTK